MILVEDLIAVADDVLGVLCGLIAFASWLMILAWRPMNQGFRQAQSRVAIGLILR
jgi:hypothetical protein